MFDFWSSNGKKVLIISDLWLIKFNENAFQAMLAGNSQCTRDEEKRPQFEDYFTDSKGIIIKYASKYGTKNKKI